MNTESETKSVKMSKSVHRKLKQFIASTDENMTAYIDRAVLSQMKADRITKRLLKQQTNNNG